MKEIQLSMLPGNCKELALAYGSRLDARDHAGRF